MTYEEWLAQVPDSIKSDPLWQFTAYQKALLLYDAVGFFEKQKARQAGCEDEAESCRLPFAFSKNDSYDDYIQPLCRFILRQHRSIAMHTITLEMKLPQPIYLALQSAGLNRDKPSERSTRNLAVQLYSDGQLSLGKAAEMAGMSLLGFWSLLVERGLPVFDYTEEDYESDLATVQRLVANQIENK
ncbi:MAG: UPF0175 family protein [candidate division KSB1 bacterium]|nr:UPF0175 family protein [candidate division KSB1 bacterium]